MERQNENSKGHQDKYYITPQLKKKLRSMNEVIKFFIALEMKDKNEAEAWKIFRSIPLPSKK